MSVLKYKDARGRWVEAPEVYCRGQLKVDVIECATDTTYDLRKYQECNHFFMFYTANQVRYLFDSANVDTIPYRLDSDPDTWYLGLWNIHGGNNDGAIATWEGANTTGKNAYKYEDGIFTWLQDNTGKCEVGGCAIVIYAE